MKRLITSALSIFLFALCSSPVEGTVLRLSTHCSEDKSQPYLAEYLDAALDFSVVGRTLTLVVANLTPENECDSAFKMNRVYFNVTDKVEGLTLTDIFSSDDSAVEEWDIGFWENGFLVGGFGRFDVFLKGGRGIHPPVVNPEKTVSFVFQISGIGPFEDSDFVTSSSSHGRHIVSYAAAKFYNDCISAFGATNVPEPATVCLLTLGGLVLLRKRL